MKHRISWLRKRCATCGKKLSLRPRWGVTPYCLPHAIQMAAGYLDGLAQAWREAMDEVMTELGEER